ncbi:hypothetical protein Tco_0900036 [Tanacetum coccineum]
MDFMESRLFWLIHRLKNFNQKVYTAKPKAVNTARPTSAVVNAVRANQVNVVKASACWVHPQKEDQGYVDSGCSRYMTGNMSYLTDFKEFDGGYVGDEAVHKQLGDRMERAATTASSLEAEQDSGNINRTQSMATLNEPNP